MFGLGMRMCVKAWSWFLRSLKECHMDVREVPFISNMSNSTSLSHVFLDSYHESIVVRMWQIINGLGLDATE